MDTKVIKFIIYQHTQEFIKPIQQFRKGMRILMEPNWWPAGLSFTLVGGAKALASILFGLHCWSKPAGALSPSSVNSVSRPIVSKLLPNKSI